MMLLDYDSLILQVFQKQLDISTGFIDHILHSLTDQESIFVKRFLVHLSSYRKSPFGVETPLIPPIHRSFRGTGMGTF